ncbi:MAG: two component, sigma54 specific, transcriptional regulator, Fis family [Bacteroidetes bacterium]|jgi:DNA-binding response OmpR family regulator|nr:two component, sigma54 specific, transcriptional regulator, Fis family [Bacteroidota bacterium]
MSHKILYTDDDASIRAAVRGEITDAGYELDEAGDGAEAIRKLEKGGYDLLLLDINMPGKSGLDVLKYIKEKNLPCRIIMLSGRLGFSVATEALKLGADEYITKPFSVEFLLLNIKKVLEKPGRAAH